MNTKARDMSKDDILKYLSVLNDKLNSKNVQGEISIVGGTVMCLCFESRLSTIDIDSVFKPQDEIELLILEIAKEHGLPATWLNDICYQFLSDEGEFVLYQSFSNLKIYTASAEYMLAMKCMSGRMYNQNEVDDIEFLVKYLKIKNSGEVAQIMKKYYPEEDVKMSVSAFIKDILNEH